MEEKKVLIVDDNVALLELIGKFLTGCGWKVCLARGGRDCWQQLGNFHPQVILLDMLLSGTSGFEIAQSLKKLHPYRDIPILAMTGLYARHDITKCLRAGCSDVLLKPFRLTVLNEFLTRLAKQIPSPKPEAMDTGLATHVPEVLH
ncbi:MAG TPA: response regulator [Candidatus Acidoferrales bacterium]|nr:response regulator [Candidatus Acidoferrales bacterium]